MNQRGPGIMDIHMAKIQIQSRFESVGLFLFQELFSYIPKMLPNLSASFALKMWEICPSRL